MKNINKSRLNLSLLLLIFSCDVAFACQTVVQFPGAEVGYIEKVGKHCLTFDIVSPRRFDIHAGEYKKSGDALLSISFRKNAMNRPRLETDFFEVDLQGHVLEQKTDNLRGIVAKGGIRRIRLLNGRVLVPGGKTALAVSLANDDGDLTLPGRPSYASRESVSSTQYEDIAAADTLDGKPPEYRKTENIVDNLNIKSGWRGVLMGGAGNILRNSTIEVDGHTAIYMFGPGTIIENNTIIVRGEGELKPFDAAIKLRDAHGALVRNNKIIFKSGWLSKAAAAINLLDSTEVKIEENTVENFDFLVRGNGEVEYKELRNIMK